MPGEAQSPIKGYRQLSDEEVQMINGVKSTGEALRELVDLIAETEGVDQRWVAIARTHLQQGFMALTRSIAKPEGF